MPAPDFPAWVMIRRPGLAPRLNPETCRGAPQTFGYLLAVLADAADALAARRALKELAPTLFHHYLASLPQQ